MQQCDTEVEYVNCVIPGSSSLSEAECKVPLQVFTRIKNATVAAALWTLFFPKQRHITEKQINVFPLTPDTSPQNKISAVIH